MRTLDFDLPEKARKFAIAAHEGQKHGLRPFYTHPALAASFMRSWRFGPDFVAAAWLHDTVEDTATTLETIAREFNDKIARMVDAVTCRGATREERLWDTYAKIVLEPDAAIVRLSDRCANLTHCRPGDRYARRYIDEAPGFETVIRPRVPPRPWRAYQQLLMTLDDTVNRA